MSKVSAWFLEMLPRPVRTQIRDRYWQIKSKVLYQFLYRALALEHTLRSGLVVKIASKGEWWTYNDIFVDGEYDVPILTAFKNRSSSRPFVVLDLGANVGYFGLRVVDLIGEQGSGPANADITMVEGSPKTYLELEKRVRSQSRLAESVSMIHGLVGQREGSAVIRESALHVKSTIMAGSALGGTRVDFVDLECLMEDKSEIDLLKCDIEGSELLFIQTYAALLCRTKRVVIELHHDQCDTKECVRLMEGLGFQQAILRGNSSFSVVLFTRS
jgi:FkbM family methyltransferase